MTSRGVLAVAFLGISYLGSSGTGNAAAVSSDVSVTKVDDKGGSSITSSIGSLVAGQPITYTISVANNGPDTAAALQITDAVLGAHAGVVTGDTWTMASGGLTGTLHTFATTGTWTGGSNTVTVASTAGMLDGSTVTGAGIPAGTFIVNHGATTITLSNATTAPGTNQSIDIISPVVTGLSSTTGLFVGQPVSGTGIPAGAKILSIDSPSQITLTEFATTNGPQALTFAFITQEVGVLHTFATTGTWTGGSNTVTVASTAGMLDGSTVTGAGIPAGTFIVNHGATTITLSNATTAPGTNQSIDIISPVVTGLSSTTGLFVGQPVSGTGIPPNAKILSIDSPSQITLTEFATTNGPQALTFAFITQEVGVLHTFATTGTWTGGSNTVTVASTAGMLDGSTVTGAGIPAGTFIVNHGATTITLSASTTAPGTNQSISIISPVVTGLSSTAGLFVGQGVSGTGIPPNAKILTIDSPSQITLTEFATTNGPESLSFGGIFVAAGSSAAGSDDISTQVDLPAGAVVTFVVTASTNPSAGGTLSNTAAAAVPPGDPTPNDNTATDSVNLLPPGIAQAIPLLGGCGLVVVASLLAVIALGVLRRRC